MTLALISARFPRPGDPVHRKDGRHQKVAAHRNPHIHIRTKGHYVPDLVLELEEFRSMFSWRGHAWVEG